jgi:hypothetical protein
MAVILVLSALTSAEFANQYLRESPRVQVADEGKTVGVLIKDSPRYLTQRQRDYVRWSENTTYVSGGILIALMGLIYLLYGRAPFKRDT